MAKILTRDEAKKLLAAKASKRAGKYNASGRHEDGHWFASGAEADRYLQLKALAAEGVIEQLELQPRYDLTVNNQRLGEYRADFRYNIVDDRGAVLYHVVEDVKGMVTDVYQLKKKLFEALYATDVNEIPARDVPKWAGRTP